MATSAILRSQDPIFQSNRHSHFRRNPNPASCPRRRKRSPSKSPPKTLAIGPVKILKRGEPLSPLPPPSDPATDRTGMDQMERIGVYAGAAIFVASPPPSELPMPGFCRINAAATCDIRRLLKLDDSI